MRLHSLLFNRRDCDGGNISFGRVEIDCAFGQSGDCGELIVTQSVSETTKLPARDCHIGSGECQHQIFRRRVWVILGFLIFFQRVTNETNARLCGYEEKPFEFVRKITRNVEHYLNYTQGRGNDGQNNLAMDSLARMTGGAFSLHYVLLLAASSFPKPLFDHFVNQLESFLFYYIFTKTPTKDLERNFSSWADELRPIGEEVDPKKQKERLNSFINDRFKTNMAAKELELSDALKRYTLYSMQQYRTRYLLAKLTQHVDMAYRGQATPGSLADYANLQIEHILPNNPKDDLLADFKAKHPKASYEECKIKLGNLTLLEKPINIVASNDFFARKSQEYAKCKHYLTSSIAGLTPVGVNTSISRINEKLAAFSDWTPDTIDQRQAMLTKLVGEVWKITPIEVN